MRVYIVYRDTVIYGVYTTESAAIDMWKHAEKERGLAGFNDIRVWIEEKLLDV